MLGREIIMYILANKLENERLSSDVFTKKLMTQEEAAVHFNVGTAAVKTAYRAGLLKGFESNGKLYILEDR